MVAVTLGDAMQTLYGTLFNEVRYRRRWWRTDVGWRWTDRTIRFVTICRRPAPYTVRWGFTDFARHLVPWGDVMQTWTAPGTVRWRCTGVVHDLVPCETDVPQMLCWKNVVQTVSLDDVTICRRCTAPGTVRWRYADVVHHFVAGGDVMQTLYITLWREVTLYRRCTSPCGVRWRYTDVVHHLVPGGDIMQTLCTP